MNDDAKMEVEALEAIFGPDFALTSPSQFSIQTIPHGADAESTYVVVKVHFTLPPSYPSLSSPDITVQSVKGLSAERCEELRAYVVAEAQKLVGEPAVFSLIEQCREWLVLRNTKGADDSMFGRMVEREGDKANKAKLEQESAVNNSSKAQGGTLSGQRQVLSPEELAKRFQGTKVTAESYKKWLDAYLKESKSNAVEVHRPTGRELFEGGLKVDEEEEEEEEEEDEDFDPAVFLQDEDDVSLGSLEDED